MNQQDLLAQISRRLGLQVAVPAISWAHLIPAEPDRQGNMAAVTFLQQPQNWQQIWSNMQWQPPQRTVPGIPRALPADQGQGEILLIPAMPMVNMGHTSMFVPLNMISKEEQNTGHHANQLTNQVMQFVCRQTAEACGATHTIRHHKLQHEEVGGAEYYTKSCSSLRAAHLLQGANGSTLLKVYHGMGTELQRWDVSSLVLTARDMNALAIFLRVLVRHYCPNQAR